MRKWILAVSVILAAISLNCEEIVIWNNPEFKIRNLNISWGNTYGGAFGFGKIQQFETSSKVITANFQYKANKNYYVTGIYGQIKSFRNRERKGFFTLITAGFDYTKGKQKPIVIVYGGPNESDDEMKKFAGLFPNITIGCGFGIKLSLQTRLLLSIDAGIKKDFASLNVGMDF